MRRYASSLWLVLGVVLVESTAASAVVWVSIENPFNSCDTQPQGCFGSVVYRYEISELEVTNSEYAVFLNAVADTDTNGLYNENMGSGVGGILRVGSSGSYVYGPISGRGNLPVNWVSWYDALRYANWLHNGQPTGAQNASTTEGGAYTFSDPSTVGARNPCAAYALPTENEWYKAAYYDGATYFDYPTGSNTATTCDSPGDPSAANCENAVGDLTAVGSYTSASSPYGTFDQGGNADEWTETRLVGTARAVRGGAFDTDPSTLAASYQVNPPAALEDDNLGFRVVKLTDLPNANPDADADCIPDVLDKCTFDSRNAVSTCDTDQDGYGNVCDGDFDQSMTVTVNDYTMYFKPDYDGKLGDPGHRGFDMNCNAAFEGDPVANSPNGVDYQFFFLPELQNPPSPGPSGLACAGTIPCN